MAREDLIFDRSPGLKTLPQLSSPKSLFAQAALRPNKGTVKRHWQAPGILQRIRYNKLITYSWGIVLAVCLKGN
jgi:hypothetical protein